MSIINSTEVVKYVKCDFCDRHTGNSPTKDGHRYAMMSTCALCGKDICNHHENCEGCEDGVLCPLCSTDHWFDCGDGIAVVNKTTKKIVKSPYI